MVNNFLLSVRVDNRHQFEFISNAVLVNIFVFLHFLDNLDEGSSPNFASKINRI